jgi:hypothetical protein
MATAKVGFEKCCYDVEEEGVLTEETVRKNRKAKPTKLCVFSR